MAGMPSQISRRQYADVRGLADRLADRHSAIGDRGLGGASLAGRLSTRGLLAQISGQEDQQVDARDAGVNDAAVALVDAGPTPTDAGPAVVDRADAGADGVPSDAGTEPVGVAPRRGDGAAVTGGQTEAHPTVRPRHVRTRPKRRKSQEPGVVPSSVLAQRLRRWIPEAAQQVLKAFLAADGGPTADRFVAYALAQEGKRYSQPEAAKPTNLNPAAFDCSALVRWAAARVGIDLPRRAIDQLAFARSRGTDIPVDQAVKTRGALLFGVRGNPPRARHVAISLGNGNTIEARGKNYGVLRDSITKGSGAPRFNKGARVPGLRY